MTQQAELEQALRSVLQELGPYLPDVVLIGGWVPYLYRHYSGFAGWMGADTFTRELDVLVDRPLPQDGRPPLAELLRNSGFRPDRERDSAAVWVRNVHRGEKIEFIAPHRGTARGQGTAFLSRNSRASERSRSPNWNSCEGTRTRCISQERQAWRGWTSTFRRSVPTS
jgi:hypothetical protein